MNALDLLATLKQEGLRIGLDDNGGLRCFGDRAAITRLLPVIKQHKPELLRILTAKATNDPTKESPDEIRPDDVHTDCEPERLYPGSGRQHGRGASVLPSVGCMARGDNPPQAGPAPASATEPTPALTGANQADPLTYWTALGWKAVFGPPGPDGRQAITWCAP